MEEIHYLYKITNLVNQKLYIGVTKNPKTRKEKHFAKSGEGRLVNKAVTKYGKENFTFEIICTGSKEYIYALEPKAIELYKSNATTGHGYNLCDGGIINNQVNKGKSISKRKDDKPVFVSGFWFPNPRCARTVLKISPNIYKVRKRNGTLGLTFTEEKEVIRSDDYNCYVMGFWFPNKRVACSKSNIDAATFYKWKSQGTLGNICHPRFSLVYDAPQYYNGFWLPTLRKTSEIFNTHPETIYKNIQKGMVEQNSKDKNSDACVGRWKIKINGNLFDSIADASKLTGISRSRIAKNLNSNNEGYSYEFSYGK